MGQIRERLFISGLSVLPKNAVSKAVGGLAHMRLPGPLSSSSIRAFVKMYDINTSETECDLTSYRSIGDFFTRRLKMGSRVIDHRPGHVVSPADGKILNSGRINNGTIIQAKGRDFTVTDLLGSESDAARFEGGSWVTVYLSPRDYHRVHHPVEGKITLARYLPGRLWPVNQAAVNHVDRLFCVNERLATFVDTPLGLVTTVMVGATSVGHITVRFDEDLQTNKNSRGGDYHYPDGPKIARGDELGTFHLGSTAIVLIESKNVILDELEPGEPVRMGSSIGRIEKKKGR
jgi:phosphatidylserine decarboxylase